MVRSLPRFVLATLVAAAFMTRSGVAGAQTPSANAKVIGANAQKLAEDAYQTGDHSKFREAIKLYKEAFGVDPHPIYQCNAGVAYKLMDELPRAHALLAQCLQRLPAVQPGAVADFRPFLDEVEGALPTAHVAVDVITTPAGASLSVSTLADDEHVLAPTVIWLPVGDHTVSAEADGWITKQEPVTISSDDLANHSKRQVKFALEKVKIDPKIVEVKVDRPVETSSPKRIAGWVSLGAGALLIAGGGVMHVVTARTRGDLAELSVGDERDETLSTFETQRSATIGLYAVGAAVAITGGVLLYLSPTHGDKVAVSPAPSGEGAMVWLRLGWNGP